MSDGFGIKRPPEDVEGAPMGGVPAPEEWYRPVLTFDSADDRRVFEKMLMDRRHATAQLDVEQLTPSMQDTVRSERGAIDSILDRMGRETDDTAEVVFETPAELNISLMLPNWLCKTLKRQGGDQENQEKAAKNLAAITAALIEAHWKDADELYPELSAVQDEYGRDADA
jgi:hypothetical protein